MPGQHRGGPARPLDSSGHVCPPLPVESLGYSFHTANMPVVAQGCVGATSCEAARPWRDPRWSATSATACAGPATSRSRSVPPPSTSTRPSATSSRCCPAMASTRPSAALAGRTAACRSTSPRPAAASTLRPRPGSRAAPERSAAMPWAGAQIAVGQRRSTSSCRRPRSPRPRSRSSSSRTTTRSRRERRRRRRGRHRANEAGLGGFEIKLFDQAGGLGDATGQITYDMFNQPVSNSLAGMTDSHQRAQRLPHHRAGRPPGGDDPDLSNVRGRRGDPPRRSPGRWSSPTSTRACTRSRPIRRPTASAAARSGCRPTRSTAASPTRRSSSPTSPATSRSSAPAASTSPSGSPTRRSSTRARGQPATARTSTAPAGTAATRSASRSPTPT